MLSIIRVESGPRPTDGTWTKVVHLYGSLKILSKLAERRLADKQCQQLPHEEVPKAYSVCVRYSVWPNGELEVRVIEVAFVVDHWTTVFSDDEGKVGAFCGDGGNRHFLTEAPAAIFKLLERHENGERIGRLTMTGPEAFPRRRVE